jgi:hypothetical protein
MFCPQEEAECCRAVLTLRLSCPRTKSEFQVRSQFPLPLPPLPHSWALDHLCSVRRFRPCCSSGEDTGSVSGQLVWLCGFLIDKMTLRQVTIQYSAVCGFRPVEFSNGRLGASQHWCDTVRFGLVLSASVSTVDIVTAKFQANKHPPLATLPHPVGPSASSTNSSTGHKRSILLVMSVVIPPVAYCHLSSIRGLDTVPQRHRPSPTPPQHRDMKDVAANSTPLLRWLLWTPAVR